MLPTRSLSCLLPEKLWWPLQGKANQRCPGTAMAARLQSPAAQHTSRGRPQTVPKIGFPEQANRLARPTCSFQCQSELEDSKKLDLPATLGFTRCSGGRHRRPGPPQGQHQ